MSFAAAAAKTAHRPVIPRDSVKDASCSEQDIDELRTKTTQLKIERIRLKTQITQMKEAQARREAAIKKVFGQTKEKQQLKTATPRTIQQLNRTLTTLTNIKEQRQEYLDSLVHGDRYVEARELELECIALYDESSRLSEENSKRQADEKDYNGAYREAVASINRVPDLRAETDAIKAETPTLQDKTEAYRRGKSKSHATSILVKLQNNPDQFSTIQSDLQSEIESLQQSLDCELVSAKQTKDAEKNSLSALNAIIEEAGVRIIDALDNPVEPGDEEKAEASARSATKEADEKAESTPDVDDDFEQENSSPPPNEPENQEPPAEPPKEPGKDDDEYEDDDEPGWAGRVETEMGVDNVQNSPK